MRAILLCIVVMTFGSACDGERVFCVEDGTFGGTIRLFEEGFVVGDELIPYSDRVFEHCEVINTILFRGGQAEDRHYPNLKVLGALSVDRAERQPGDGPAMAVLEGFDGVTDIGVLNGVDLVLGFGALERANEIQVRDVLGMPRLEEVGSLRTGRIDALTALHTAGEVILYAEDLDYSVYGAPPLREITYGLPALRTVFGTLEVSSDADYVGFPELVDVGSIFICCMSNTRGLQDMSTPQQTTVADRLILQGLEGSDEHYRAWAERNIRSVGGLVLIEGNRGTP